MGSKYDELVAKQNEEVLSMLCLVIGFWIGFVYHAVLPYLHEFIYGG